MSFLSFVSMENIAEDSSTNKYPPSSPHCPSTDRSKSNDTIDLSLTQITGTAIATIEGGRSGGGGERRRRQPSEK